MNRYLLVKSMLGAALVLGLAATGGCASMPVGNPGVPQPARAVELSRYLGTWYEIGRYPNRFETDCEAVTAQYGVRDDGQISVTNSCHKGSPQGRLEVARGKARVVDPVSKAKLNVSFFGPFWGNYWVLDHAEDYSWSIVGEPSGRYLWLLSRDPHPDDAKRAMIESRAHELGYDLSLLYRPKH